MKFYWKLFYCFDFMKKKDNIKWNTLQATSKKNLVNVSS